MHVAMSLFYSNCAVVSGMNRAEIIRYCNCVGELSTTCTAAADHREPVADTDQY